jgi:glucose-6-phosphate isomerase
VLDYSKHRVTDETLRLLMAWPDAAGVEARRDAMFAGDHINTTEDRAVLHVALRMPQGSRSRRRAGRRGDVHAVLTGWAISLTASATARGSGPPGKRIRAVVNIGIGGSDLGPAMATERWPTTRPPT